MAPTARRLEVGKEGPEQAVGPGPVGVEERPGRHRSGPARRPPLRRPAGWPLPPAPSSRRGGRGCRPRAGRMPRWTTGHWPREGRLSTGRWLARPGGCCWVLPRPPVAGRAPVRRATRVPRSAAAGAVRHRDRRLPLTRHRREPEAHGRDDGDVGLVAVLRADDRAHKRGPAPGEQGQVENDISQQDEPGEPRPAPQDEASRDHGTATRNASTTRKASGSASAPAEPIRVQCQGPPSSPGMVARKTDWVVRSAMSCPAAAGRIGLGTVRT